MLEIISNGRGKTAPAWDTKSVGTIEDLLEALNVYILDPSFEQYGNFVNNNPQWSKSELQEKYNGCTKFFGNFLNCSHVFNIVTDEPELVANLTKAIEHNKNKEAYTKAKEEYYKKCRTKEEMRIKWINKEISFKEYNNYIM